VAENIERSKEARKAIARATSVFKEDRGDPVMISYTIMVLGL